LGKARTRPACRRPAAGGLANQWRSSRARDNRHTFASYGAAASSRNGAEVFGRALAVLRLSRGMSRNELAQAASIGPSNLSNYQHGLSRGELESLDPILEEVSAAYRLLGRSVHWARRTW
jgi:hypothetical protein